MLKKITFLCLFISLFLWLSRCSFPEAPETCLVSPDQYKTFSGSWEHLPIQIALAEGEDFDTDSSAAVVDALETWNAFFQKKASLTLFDYGSKASPRKSSEPLPSQIPPPPSFDSVQKGRFVRPVVLYRRSGVSAWMNSSHVLASTHIAIRSLPENSSSSFVWGTLLIDPKTTAGFDLRSIVAHELGHLLGLEHSCQPGRTPKGIPSCSDPKLKLEYREALLFPWIGIQEIKHSLRKNDEERAGCLYPQNKTSSLP